MVECELNSDRCRLYISYSFNRYMVECELCDKASFSAASCVLIDTWWNVNDVQSALSKITITVLIDTWWNVNTLHTAVICRIYEVLIDTWWNVNYFGGNSNSSLDIVLIDTWWNVNFGA